MGHRAPVPAVSRATYLTQILAGMGVARPAEAADTLLGRFSTFSALSRASPAALIDLVPGTPELGKALAAALQIVGAGVRERAIETTLDPADEALHGYLRLTLAHREAEILLGLFADRAGRLIAERTLAMGDGQAVCISAAAILRQAIALGARQILLVHNHPSGDARPSAADRQAMAELQRRAETVEVELLDHLIVGRTDIFSLRAGRALRGSRSTPPRSPSPVSAGGGHGQ